MALLQRLWCFIAHRTFRSYLTDTNDPEYLALECRKCERVVEM